MSHPLPKKRIQSKCGFSFLYFFLIKKSTFIIFLILTLKLTLMKQTPMVARFGDTHRTTRERIMNGRVRREYLQRLSKNLTNQELGLNYVTDEAEDHDSASSPPPPYYRGGDNDSKRNREPLVHTEYMAKYNRTLQAVRGNNNKKNSYKLKRRKIAPSLRKKKNNLCVVSSPYFPMEASDNDNDESEEEIVMSSSTTSVLGGSGDSSTNTSTKRSLGRQAASRYPKYGLLDLSSSSSSSPIGLKLGQSSFDVPSIKKLPGDIPREDGFDSEDEAEDEGPFGDEWQRKEFARQKLLEEDDNYRFIYLLAGNVNTSVIKLYDEDRLEDMILRRMNVRRQMQTIRKIQEIKIPRLLNEMQQLEMFLEVIKTHMTTFEEHRELLKEANEILQHVTETRKEIDAASDDLFILNEVQNLLFKTERILRTATWMKDLKKLKLAKTVMKSEIQNCVNFLFDITKATNRQREIQKKLILAAQTPVTLLRALFVCLSHFVAYLWTKVQKRNHDIPDHLNQNSVMQQWIEIVETPLLFDDAAANKIGLNLSAGNAYSDLLTSLRGIWISYWVPKPEEEEEEEEEEEPEEPEQEILVPEWPEVSNKMRREITHEFSRWSKKLENHVTELKKARELLQRDVRTVAQDLGDLITPIIPPQSLDDWETELRHWASDLEEGSRLTKDQQHKVQQKLQAVTKAITAMEIIQPPRVKYQHRKSWALSPQHSGHVPLDAKVVAAIEAAIDVMRDVKNELRGARADYIRNVLQAGANMLQHSPLSRAAFAKLVASRMAMQEEYFPSTWTRKEQMGRIRIQAASALRSLSNLRWTGSKLVDRQAGGGAYYNRIMMQPPTSMWGTTVPNHIPW